MTVAEETLQLRSECTSKLRWHANAYVGKFIPCIVIGNVTTEDGGEIEIILTGLFVMVRLYCVSDRNS